MLATSRGRLDICKLLLEAGADPALKDGQGCDALTIALLSGQAAVAALLLGANGSRDQEAISNASDVDRKNADTSIDGNEADFVYANKIAEQLADRGGEASDKTALTLSIADEDRAFDISGWQDAVDPPPPADDPACANDAGALQGLLSGHVPIDMDTTWDDVEIDLPESHDLTLLRVQLPPEARQVLRAVVIEARIEPKRTGAADHGLRRDRSLRGQRPTTAGCRASARSSIRAARLHFRRPAGPVAIAAAGLRLGRAPVQFRGRGWGIGQFARPS
jgi:hypothetical protein